MTICINDDTGKRLYPVQKGNEVGSRCSSKISLKEATGLITLSGIGRWNMGSIDNFQKKRFRSFALYGSHTFQRMRKVQQALRDRINPPSIVAIGQEGGIVSRFGWIPNLKAIWGGLLVATGKPKLAKETGFLTGQLLRLYGINLNFAPFMDLHAYWPKRRFSADPRKIAKYGGAFMQGLLRTRVGACAKHFPDGGERAAGDPHKKVVTVNYTMAEMKIKERYQPLINNGLPAIMMSHVIFRQVDPTHPASLSKKWINYLRHNMNFKGLIVTDALEMKAIKLSKPNAEDAIIAAFNAGADLILASPQAVRQALTRGVLTGKISPRRIQESVVRILTFQKRYPIKVSNLTPSRRKRKEAVLLKKIANLYQRVQRTLRYRENLRR